ncbi:uncharacterized protein LOC130742347 isoform X1 [Lotus japonicus]|uniref:uncharacterized protein LOC130742347 isoform X1 n=1 Tax=Lotus japonicus TaxID=34305 RepID=UPI0025877DEA|nr:uncharacterized protein LOC130742347 isoform X1 [Lotus japonicus]XP_057450433.1 uncharacterized protein LOC130742347 isoform X1 [Lotus japonicus]XP_057450434.1 uncharacterized protein LOC130742347 isoform X1 [Lotus japonicus]
MNAKGHKFVRFGDWKSESSFSIEQEGSVNNGYHKRKGIPSVSAILKSIGRRLESGTEKVKSLRRHSAAVHPLSDGKTKKPTSGCNILDPQGSMLQKWNKIFVITCVMAVSVDPLFFYIPVIVGKNKSGMKTFFYPCGTFSKIATIAKNRPIYTWRVKVRVLHVWDMFPVGEPSKPYAIHVVLIDVEGVKIEGIIKKAFLPNCLRSGVAILIVTMHQYTLRSSKSKQQIFARVFHPEEVTMKFVFYVWSEMKILDTDHIFFFLCLFLWNIQVYIFVPRQFLNDFEESLSKYVELVDPVGNKFCVSFYFDRDEPRFGANISELRTVHQIQGSVIICFIYLGDSRFDIQISDLNLFEIEYRKRTAHVAANVASSSHLNFHEVECSVINLISDDDSENEVEDIVN